MSSLAYDSFLNWFTVHCKLLLQMSCQWMFLIEVNEFRVNSEAHRPVHDENACNMQDLVSFSRKSHVSNWLYGTVNTRENLKMAIPRQVDAIGNGRSPARHWAGFENMPWDVVLPPESIREQNSTYQPLHR